MKKSWSKTVSNKIFKKKTIVHSKKGERLIFTIKKVLKN